jgi:hypothetical protein
LKALTFETLMIKYFESVNPLTPKTEKCSDYAENLTTYSSRYSKNFYPFIFYLALLKSFRIKCVFNFQTFLQSWARAFFGSSRLRFRAPGGTLSRWRFRALFWALNFALLRSRFRAPSFSRSYFALLDFHARIFALLDFRARTSTLLISFRATGFLSHSRFPFAHVCL